MSFLRRGSVSPMFMFGKSETLPKKQYELPEMARENRKLCSTKSTIYESKKYEGSLLSIVYMITENILVAKNNYYCTPLNLAQSTNCIPP